MERGRSNWIRALLPFSGLLLIAFSFLPNRGRSEPASRNDLEVNPPSVSQLVSSAEPVELTFRLTNHGSIRLVLGNVQTSCGCTVPVPFTERQLSPAKSTTLTVRITPARYGTTQVTVGIPYHRNGSEQQIEVPVTLIGRTLDVPFVVRMPDYLRVQQFAAGSGRREFFIQTHEVRSADPWLTAR